MVASDIPWPRALVKPNKDLKRRFDEVDKDGRIKNADINTDDHGRL